MLERSHPLLRGQPHSPPLTSIWVDCLTPSVKALIPRLLQEWARRYVTDDFDEVAEPATIPDR